MWENIDKILKERKINVLQLARGTNIPPTTIYTWKNGKTTPSADKLAKVAEFLNVSVDFLLGKTTEQNPRPKTQEIQNDSDLSFINEIMKYYKNMNENKRKAIYTISADINDMDEFDIEFVKSFIKNYLETKKKQNK